MAAQQQLHQSRSNGSEHHCSRRFGPTAAHTEVRAPYLLSPGRDTCQCAGTSWKQEPVLSAGLHPSATTSRAADAAGLCPAPAESKAPPGCGHLSSQHSPELPTQKGFNQVKQAKASQGSQDPLPIRIRADLWAPEIGYLALHD